jgi:uncharacterized protein (DUF2236 family)
LAGVWDHSSFRKDLIGRLRRTTNFVAATTYAPRAEALRLIERVRRIHSHVRGLTESGQPYSADEPTLLTWVHTTEAFSFLQGYRQYAGPVSEADADRYYDETRRVAEALGAQDVPKAEQEVANYFAHVQTQLAFTERSRTVLEILQRMALPVPLSNLSRDIFLGAGAALLPEWAIGLIPQQTIRALRPQFFSTTLRMAAPMFRLGLNDGPAQRACRRMGKDPSWVRRPFPA